ncbi:MAG: hypothetical protein EPN85_09265 [Bacteroidetes bacterium]|nr:MAG: hypothetical protein EPN85_09265 [Bacteroidota bacterium]
MRTAVILLLISIAVFITSCMVKKQTTTEVATFTDLTGIHIAEPSIKDIMHLYDFDAHKWNGGVFRSSTITNVSFNQTDQVNIQAENEWSSSFPLQRAEKINQFQKSIEDIITKNKQIPVGKNNSSIYFPIAEELNRLSQSTSERKYLLIYSDLMENNPVFSFYKKEKLNEISATPDSIKNVLESQLKIKTLGGITIYLIYQPANTTEDEQYKIVSKFYKELFENKGARVIITANITI